MPDKNKKNYRIVQNYYNHVIYHVYHVISIDKDYDVTEEEPLFTGFKFECERFIDNI